MISANPLAPTVQVQASLALMTRPRGVANKPQMGFIVCISQGSHQSCDATGDPAGPGVFVRTFEGENMELHGKILRRSLVGKSLSPYMSGIRGQSRRRVTA